MHRAVAECGLREQQDGTLEATMLLVMGIMLHDGCVGKQGTSAKQPDAASVLQQLRSHMLRVWAAPAAPSHWLEALRLRPP
eukprot:70838-Prymnesium_polylepis.1